jgi:hypothetical protein
MQRQRARHIEGSAASTICLGYAFAMRAILLLAALTLSAHAQWQILDSHSTADFRGVDSVGAGVVWVSGTNGTVLRSEDAGYLWQHCAMPPGAEKLDFRGIQAFDANTAIVMSSGPGDQSRLYKTTDGCQSWKLVLTNLDEKGFFDGLSMFYPHTDGLGHTVSEAYAVGNVLGDPVNGFFSIFSTDNGGSTWTRRVPESRGPKGMGCKVDVFKAEPKEADFAASNEGILTFGGPYFLFVTGGGDSRLGFTDLSNWDGAFCHESVHFKNLPLKHDNDSSGAFALAADPRHITNFDFPSKIVIVGGDYRLPDAISNNAVVVSGLGELTQRITEPTTPPHGFRSAVAYEPTARTWITVGPNGTDVSTDDGRNWRALKPDPKAGDAPDADQHWNALSLPFVVGPHGRIGILRATALKP